MAEYNKIRPGVFINNTNRNPTRLKSTIRILKDQNLELTRSVEELTKRVDELYRIVNLEFLSERRTHGAN